MAGLLSIAVGNASAIEYTLTDLGTLGGLTSSAYGINDDGQVVGDSYTSGGYDHAFLYSGGTMHDLGTLGGIESQAYGINNSGQVVGCSMTSGNTATHAFLYSGGAMQRPRRTGRNIQRCLRHQQQR